jgi:hypothetical protein
VELSNVWETGFGLEEGTHQSLDLGLGHILESGRFDGLPGGVHGVDLLSDVSDSGSVRNFLSSAFVDSEGAEGQ